MIALTQLLIKYVLFEPFGVNTTLDALGIGLLVLASVCIASAGNIINDIYDVETDTINKPDRLIVGKSISEKTSYNLFFALNIAGVGIGYYLSNSVGKNGFFSIFVVISALLYIYASYLKSILVIGNLLVSALVASSILIVGLFELIPGITASNREVQLTFFKVLLDYALFAFIINFLREIAKDIEDMEGDSKSGMLTLPVVIGRKRAGNILSILTFLPLFAISYYVLHSLYKNQIAVIYFLIFIIAPLIYTTIMSFTAKTKIEYRHIGNVYKLVLFFGILSMLLYLLIL